MRKSVLSKCYSLVFFGLAMASQASANDQVNPAHVYLLNGKPVSGWSLTLGDAANWSVPVNNQQGQSEGKKVLATQVDFNEQHKALSLTGMVARRNTAVLVFSVRRLISLLTKTPHHWCWIFVLRESRTKPFPSEWTAATPVRAN